MYRASAGKPGGIAVGRTTGGPEAGDAELRMALARRYDVAPAALDGCVIVREKQAIIIRPIAYYG